MARVRLNSEMIRDWPSFHAEFGTTLGFPDFYGANMNAWIDCLSDLREDTGMVGIRLGPGEILELEIPGIKALRERVPELVDALLDCTAAVNQRYVADGQRPAVVLVPL